MAEHSPGTSKWARMPIHKARPSRRDRLADEAKDIAEKMRNLKLEQEHRASLKVRRNRDRAKREAQ
jgi:hypothetical protein